MEKNTFLQLVDKYLTGNASPAEQELVEAYYRELELSGITELSANEEEEQCLVTWNKLQATIATAPSLRSSFVKTGWFRYAAVLLILAGTAFYLYQSNQLRKEVTKNPIDQQPEILPGSNKAILTLADGSTIVLDSAGNGAVAMQGNAQIIKLSNGQIAYTLSANENKNLASNNGSIAYNTITTPHGGQYQVALPDGSNAWLNAASSIRFPISFEGGERKVTISGEVYFEVLPNKTVPFVVATNAGLAIEVIGTRFNINSYSDEPVVQTTLLQGSVKVVMKQPSGGSNSLLLQPGQQAELARTGDLKLVRGADTEQVMAWKNGLFHFKNADIKTVMRQLARWYNMEVHYEGKITNEKFEGKLPRDADAAQLLRVLQKNQLHFRLEGKKLTILP